MYIASKKWAGNNMSILFLMFITSFSFWPAGTNGIRSAIASSLIILGLSYNNKIIRYALFLLAFLFHASMIIPIAAYILTIFIKKPKYYFFGWLMTIPLSLTMGNFWQKLFASLSFDDERKKYLVDDRYADLFSHTGFRWDFLIYSSIAVLVGYYFVKFKKFKDPIYFRILNIYLAANAFWILILRASHSNRFAYLSWFLMAAVIFYPLLNKRFMKNQHLIVAFGVFFYFAFTYIMNIII